MREVVVGGDDGGSGDVIVVGVVVFVVVVVVVVVREACLARVIEVLVPERDHADLEGFDLRPEALGRPGGEGFAVSTHVGSEWAPAQDHQLVHDEFGDGHLGEHRVGRSLEALADVSECGADGFDDVGSGSGDVRVGSLELELEEMVL